ncbi:MAG: ABC transporter permease [Methylothermaceae bacteria B42]|nr:MAG: ABC transporter permease [Methylothermaceae bacteria B42]HHJ39108.1 ABC transporter permease [Methylothermaceae bacterium]
MRAGTWIICQRELASYFSTPLAYVFLVIFLIMSGVFTFYLGGFYERNQADLRPFFDYHPWLYLFLIPAVAMRLWAEERKTGTIELLLTLPLTLRDAVLGKFLAAWLFVGLALVLTFPLWITVNWLGNPDNGVILAAYLGSWLMAGAYLAIGECLSAATSNQVIAFILTVVVCFVFVAAGFPLVLEAFYHWAPTWLVDGIASLSFLTHFHTISKGVLDLRDILFFLIMISGWLSACALVIEMKKAG